MFMLPVRVRRSSLRVSSCMALIISVSSLFFLLLHSSVEAFVIVGTKAPDRHHPFVVNKNQSLRTLLPAEWRSFVSCCLQEKKQSYRGEEDDDGSGWGFDVDDELVAQAEQELSRTTSATETHERDWFIPLFALVSITGFAGLYAYELFRLYFAGELYLPFLH